MRTKLVFTGLLDKKLQQIYYGNMIKVGMRRNDPKGWTIEVVTRGQDGLPQLTDPLTCEHMQMQWDQELRKKV